MTRMVAMEFGAVADQAERISIHEVETTLHDRLLSHLGPKRRSGVTWRHYAASDAAVCRCLVTLDESRNGPEEEKLLGYLSDNPAGLLIVATCEWDQ